jgi:predicted DNA-binding protein
MPVSIRLGQDLEERLAKASRKLRVNKTQVIRRSLEAYLAQVEPGRTACEIGEKLFGADQRPGRDLSSNFKGRLKARLRAKHHR